MDMQGNTIKFKNLNFSTFNLLYTASGWNLYHINRNARSQSNLPIYRFFPKYRNCHSHDK